MTTSLFSLVSTSLILGLSAPVLSFAQTDLIGKTVAAVVAERGNPQSKVVAGNRAIYRWANVQVVFVDGRATEYKVQNQTVPPAAPTTAQTASAPIAPVPAIRTALVPNDPPNKANSDARRLRLKEVKLMSLQRAIAEREKIIDRYVRQNSFSPGEKISTEEYELAKEQLTQLKKELAEWKELK